MVITLLSDFGLQDSYVAQAKGILLQHSYTDHIIDISHQVSPFSIANASYLLKECFDNFPKKTIHLALVNISQQLPAKALMLELNEQWVIAADNGFLPMFVAEKNRDNAIVYELPITANSYYEWLQQVAIVIGKLYGNPHLLKSYTTIALAPNELLMHLNVTNNAVECNVLHIDSFGNIIFAIHQDMFEKLRNGRSYKIRLRGNVTIDTIVTHYTDVPVSEKLARFNSIGYLEIAVREDTANMLFGYNLAKKEHVFYTTIKIEFYDY
jgi:S-adenosylmethionine hydrolase